MGKTRFFRRMGRGLALAVAIFSGGSLRAEPLMPLNAKDRAPWSAVGHLAGPGFRLSRGCTGTLIAPDLVVTAAHCMTGALGRNNEQRFRAGLHGDRAVAERAYAEVQLHPLFSLRQGHARLPYDVAVIRLTTPIATEEVEPLPLIQATDPPRRQARLLGYRHDRPNVLSGRSDCQALTPPGPGVRRYDCEVVAGTSGGAVIVDTGPGPALEAVIVARDEPSGHALAVPVNTWLREKLTQAMARQ